MAIVTSLQTGLKTGLKSSLNASIYGSTVTRDGPSLVATPASAAEWVALGLPAPGWQWNCQEASGNLVCSVTGLTLAGTGSGKTYSNTVSGWTRKFLYIPEVAGACGWNVSDASMNQALSESWAYLLYTVLPTAPASNRQLLSCGTNNGVFHLNSPAGQIRSTHGGNNSTTAVDHRSATDVRAILWYRNATSNTSGNKTSLGSSTGTHNEAAVGTSQRGLGAVSGQFSSAQYPTFFAIWKGVDAETVAANGLTLLGW